MLNRGNIVYSFDMGNNNIISEQYGDTGKLILNDAKSILSVTKNGVIRPFVEPENFSDKKSPKSNETSDNGNNKNTPDIERKDDTSDIQISFIEDGEHDTNIKIGNNGTNQLRISEILMYVAKDYMSDICTEDTSFYHIKMMFFSCDKDNIVFRSYEKSPITGNLEVLLKISQKIKVYEKNKLEDVLKKSKNREKCEARIKYFNYALNSHILKVINNIMQLIHGDRRQTDLAHKLQNYAVNMMNKINQYIYHELEIVSKKNDTIENMIDRIAESKRNMQNGIDSLERELNVQNTKLDTYIEKLSRCEFDIGAKIDNNLILKGGSLKSNITHKTPEPQDNTSLSFSGSNLSQSIESKLNEKLGKKIDDLFTGNDENGFDEETHEGDGVSMVDTLSDEDTNFIYRML